MAHKKGVGSSKNGRESHSKRLGVRYLVVKLAKQVILSFVKEVLNSIRVKTSEWVKTTLFSL